MVLDAFLQFNEYQILKDAGKVSHEVAMKLVEKEYAKLRVIQDQNFVSDFETVAAKIKKANATVREDKKENKNDPEQNELKKITKPTKSDKKKK